MKRRFRIAMTILSLVLAVTTLSYGVYAAIQSRFKVTSQVSFTAVNVLVEITQIKVFQADFVSSVVTKQPNAIKNITTGFYDPAFSPTGDNTSESTVELSGLTFNDEANGVVRRYIVFEIYYKNYSQYGVNVNLNPTNASESPSVLPANIVLSSSAGVKSPIPSFSSSLAAATNISTPREVANPTSTNNSANSAFIVIIYLNDLTQAFTNQNLILNVIFTKA